MKRGRGSEARPGNPIAGRYRGSGPHGFLRVALRISNEQIGELVPEQLQEKQSLSLVARIRLGLEVLVSNLSAHGDLRVGVRRPDSRAVPCFRGTALIG